MNVKKKYDELCLSRTPSGPALAVHLTEVSASLRVKLQKNKSNSARTRQ